VVVVFLDVGVIDRGQGFLGQFTIGAVVFIGHACRVDDVDYSVEDGISVHWSVRRRDV